MAAAAAERWSRRGVEGSTDGLLSCLANSACLPLGVVSKAKPRQQPTSAPGHCFFVRAASAASRRCSSSANSLSSLSYKAAGDLMASGSSTPAGSDEPPNADNAAAIRSYSTGNPAIGLSLVFDQQR